jgi:hypothetical protein
MAFEGGTDMKNPHPLHICKMNRMNLPKIKSVAATKGSPKFGRLLL